MKNIAKHKSFESIEIEGSKYMPIVYLNWIPADAFGEMISMLKEEFRDGVAIVEPNDDGKKVTFIKEEIFEEVDKAIGEFIKTEEFGSIEQKIKEKLSPSKLAV